METNIILAGVGGQGILSISYVIDMAALKQGLHFKQAEVHGMSQRGGAVQSHLRISHKPIHSDLLPKGSGDLILSVEPLESLRYVDYLSPHGTLVSSVDPFVNIPDYPPIEKILDAIGTLPNHTLVHAAQLAKEAGSARAQNMVLLGAAAPYLGIREELLQESIMELFARKGEKVQQVNLNAFHSGKASGAAYRTCRQAGMGAPQTRALTMRLRGGSLDTDAVTLWKELLDGPMKESLMEAFHSTQAGNLAGNRELPQRLQDKGHGPLSTEQIQQLLFCQ